MKKSYRITNFENVKIGRRFRYNKKWLKRESIFTCTDEYGRVHPLKVGAFVAAELGDTYD